MRLLFIDFDEYSLVLTCDCLQFALSEFEERAYSALSDFLVFAEVMAFLIGLRIPL